MRSQSEIFYTIILATIFVMVLATVMVMAVWRYYARKRKHELEVLQFDHTLLQTRLEIQEQTFQTISQEIHDNSGQLLSLAKLQLNTMDFRQEPEAREKVDTAIDLITQTIQSLRDMARNLHSESIFRMGLIAAVETEVRIIEKLGIMHAVLRVVGTETPIKKDNVLIIFRIIQEALHNVVKHARATVVEVEINYSTEGVALFIKDNGVGINASLISDGSGLRNMKDRARAIGADLQIGNNENSGTLITLSIPNT